MRGRIFESLMHLLLMKIVLQNSILCQCDCQKNVFPGQLFGVRCSTAFLWVYNQYFLVQIEDFLNNALNFCPELGHLCPEIAWRRFELESRDNIGTNSRYFVLDQQICCTWMCIWKWLLQFLLLQWMPELVQYSGHADDNAGLKNSIVRDSKIKRRSTLPSELI